ncbi:MAG: response regulator [Bacteriovorax sp.]|nr:response regulator [Bacteriovorax sp.]
MSHSSLKLGKIIPEKYRVMILDNNKDIAELIGMHLEKMNHTNYELSFSVTDSLDKIETKEYDLLLLDWSLDDGTCFDLIDKIRSMNKSLHPRTTSALIVVVTGKDTQTDKKKLERYQIKEHFIKPFVYEEFEKNIKAAIMKHSRTQ